MNHTFAHLIAAAALLAAAPAGMAASDGPSADARTTREQVRAEFFRARAAGEVHIIETRYPFIPQVAPSIVKREQVLAEVVRSRSTGELDMIETNYPLSAKEAQAALAGAAPRPPASDIDLNKATERGTGLASQ